MKTIISTVLVSGLVAASPALAQCGGSGDHASTTARVVNAGHHMEQGKDIVETAVAAGSFNTLAAALKAAGLVGALKGDGPFTVFAPTDEAFAKLPKGTIESLLKPENKEKLAGILKYHVVKGRVYASDAIAAKSASTLGGSEVTIRLRGGAVNVNDSKVIAADIDASNGVVHVIDTVLLP